MITLRMIQLQSFGRVVLVPSLVPMGLIGVVGALLLFNKPLGFVAILGVLSLIGMIARNAVILIEQIEAERKLDKETWNAVVDAAISCFPAYHANSDLDRSGSNTHRWGDILGTDGFRNHGRVDGCDPAYLDLPAVL